MRTKPRSRLDPSARSRSCVQLDRHVLGYRQYLSDRGNAAGYARSCEAAVAHLSMWMKGAKKSLANIDEGLVAEFATTTSPAANAQRVHAIRAACVLRWATCLSSCAPPAPSRPSRWT